MELLVKMHTLSIQIHAERASPRRMEDIEFAFAALAQNSDLVAAYLFSRGDECGIDSTSTFDTRSPNLLWKTIDSRIFPHSESATNLKNAAIVVCSGSAGWDDYFLVSHFDASECVDELPAD